MTNDFLVDQIVSAIPEAAWSLVKTTLITIIVDNMPTFVVERLTNDPTDFDRAEEILTDYYNKPGFNRELIVDSFRILGDETTCSILDSLQLNSDGIYTESTAPLQPMQDRQDVGLGIGED